MDQLILLLYLVLIVAPISTILHEAGHLFGAKSVRAEKIELRIGIGKPLVKRKFSNVVFIVHQIYFIGGMTKSEREPPYNNKEKIWISMLGPTANTVFAFLASIYLYNYPNKWISLLFWFNVWMAAGNLIPFRWRGSQTDGLTILQLLKNR